MPVEAMATGAAVLASHLGGTAESIVDGVSGALVDFRSPAECLAAVDRLSGLLPDQCPAACSAVQCRTVHRQFPRLDRAGRRNSRPATAAGTGRPDHAGRQVNQPVDQPTRPVDLGRQQTTLGVCVVNYHSLALVTRLIESLAAARGTAALTVGCVDNSECDSEFRELCDLVPLAARLGIVLTVTQSPSNVGYAAGNNLAARVLIADGVDALLVVNPDIGIRAGTLDAICELVELFSAADLHGQDAGRPAPATAGSPA